MRNNNLRGLIIYRSDYKSYKEFYTAAILKKKRLEETFNCEYDTIDNLESLGAFILKPRKELSVMCPIDFVLYRMDYNSNNDFVKAINKLRVQLKDDPVYTYSELSSEDRFIFRPDRI